MHREERLAARRPSADPETSARPLSDQTQDPRPHRTVFVKRSASATQPDRSATAGEGLARVYDGPLIFTVSTSFDAVAKNSSAGI